MQKSTLKRLKIKTGRFYQNVV